MTPRQADKLIKSAAIVTVRNVRWNETIIGKFVGRNRWNVLIEYSEGKQGLFDRGELELV